MLFRLFLSIAFLATTLFIRSETIEIKTRIVSGKSAYNGQFPWHVLVKKSEHSKSICGGSLISSKWVLTISNCLKHSTSVFLMLGTTSLYDETALNMTSTDIYEQPFYRAALIKLPQTVIFTDEIQPIALQPTSFGYKDFENSLAEISGFGAEADKWILRETHQLKYTEVRIISLGKCNKWEIDDFICGKNDKPTGSICDGDLGGALVVKDINGKPLQIGIVNEIPEFCDWPVPLTFLQIHVISQWISGLTKITF